MYSAREAAMRIHVEEVYVTTTGAIFEFGTLAEDSGGGGGGFRAPSFPFRGCDKAGVVPLKILDRFFENIELVEFCSCA